MSAPTAPHIASQIAPPASLPDGPEPAWHWLTTELAGRPVPPVVGVIGLGDGSLLEALDAKAPGTKVLALEPDPVAARAVLALALTAVWRQSGRLVYLSGPDYPGADNAWRIFPSRVEAPPMLVHPSAAAVAGVAKAVSVFKKVVFGAVANSNARKKFAPRYLLNSLKNLPSIVNGRDVRALTNAATGIPAIVVGAGPSLDVTLDELARLRNRAIIIATDTSLRPLLTRGIVPQLVVGLDPSDLNARHLLELPECRDTWLVAESALDPGAIAGFEGRTFWFRVAPHHPWPWYNEQGIDVGRLDVWGSVLTGAFQVAHLAGCDPIVTVGADLSFPGGRPYARGTTYEFDWAWAAAFGTPVEETRRKLMAGRNDLRTEKNLTGVDTPTTGAMLQFRDWLLGQARKSDRRIVNASGAGMFYGEGVEQASLSDVLTQDRALPTFDALERTSKAVSRKSLARTLRTLRSELAAARTEAWPLSGWKDFSGEGFEPEQVGAALAGAALELEEPRLTSTAKRRAAGLATDAAPSVFASLPESATRLRQALRGEPITAPDGFEVTAENRSVHLVRSLELLERVVSGVMTCQDFVSFPDPELIGEVSAGGICMWPETTRWTVQQFEAHLAHAWNNDVARPTRPPAAFGDVVPRQPVGGPKKPVTTARPHATHACVLLAVEWLRCASSVGDAEAAALQGAIDRLWALEQWLRNVKVEESTGAHAELIIEAKVANTKARTTTVVLPLGVPEEALARLLTGTMQVDGRGVWALAHSRGDLVIRVGVRAQRTHQPEWKRTPAFAITPRMIAVTGKTRLTVVDQVPDGALCAMDYTPEAAVITPDGKVVPHQTWPRAITGALVNDKHGEVAWKEAIPNVSGGPVPHLLHRPTPGAEVTVTVLPFRPDRGLWRDGRLYLTSRPTPDAKGGIGSWAPGEEVRFEWPDLELLAILPLGDQLALEPDMPSPPNRSERRRATHGWTWTPGQPPTSRALGPLGAVSGVASSGDWTARAYPQADVIQLEGPDGRVVSMRCYKPMRVAWAGDALAVSAGDRHAMLFEHLLAALSAWSDTEE